jgi:hypothetical protein
VNEPDANDGHPKASVRVKTLLAVVGRSPMFTELSPGPYAVPIATSNPTDD